MIKWAKERHDHWCRELFTWAGELKRREFQHPYCHFVVWSNKIAGRYYASTDIVEYNLAYLYTAKHAFDRTIAHEVCHSVACKLRPSAAWHGDFFMFLLQDVCGLDSATAGHDYDVRAAKQIASYLKQLEKINNAKSKTVERTAASVRT